MPQGKKSCAVLLNELSYLITIIINKERNMDIKTGFFAYPSAPSVIGQTIEEAVSIYGRFSKSATIETWRSLDIAGHFISEEVTSSIEDADMLIADISALNFNVTYEIGYAIGQSKRIILTRNKAVAERAPTIREVGIFDTLGYLEYENSNGLASILRDSALLKIIDIPQKINKGAPVYLVDAKHKTDTATRIISRIKKARYRGFKFEVQRLTKSWF